MKRPYQTPLLDQAKQKYLHISTQPNRIWSMGSLSAAITYHLQQDWKTKVQIMPHHTMQYMTGQFMSLPYNRTTLRETMHQTGIWPTWSIPSQCQQRNSRGLSSFSSKWPSKRCKLSKYSKYEQQISRMTSNSRCNGEFALITARMEAFSTSPPPKHPVALYSPNRHPSRKIAFSGETCGDNQPGGSTTTAPRGLVGNSWPVNGKRSVDNLQWCTSATRHGCKGDNAFPFYKYNPRNSESLNETHQIPGTSL